MSHEPQARRLYICAAALLRVDRRRAQRRRNARLQVRACSVGLISAQPPAGATDNPLPDARRALTLIALGRLKEAAKDLIQVSELGFGNSLAFGALLLVVGLTICIACGLPIVALFYVTIKGAGVLSLSPCMACIPCILLGLFILRALLPTPR
eukprot:5717043-Prymnesium_polylepis.1